MMNTRLAALAALLTLSALGSPTAAAADFTDPRVLESFVFGSCNHQSKPQPAWAVMGALEPKPDLFIFTGDNVYTDAKVPDELKAGYAALAANPDFNAFREAVPIIATWDDHDYGLNDSGAENPIKRESQEILLDFFGEPADSPRRTREGIYGSWLYGPAERQVEVILLDSRYHRTPLVEIPKEQRQGKERWAANTDPAATILGAEQWQWLERTVRESPAQLLVVVSSIQVLPTEHPYEKWSNFPLERQRLLALLGTRPTIILSGDRHIGEISLSQARPHRAQSDAVPADAPALYEVTSSGLTHSFAGGADELNRLRIGPGNVTEPNFGRIVIDWGADADGGETGTPVRMQLWKSNGGMVMERVTSVMELSGAARE